MPQRTGKGSAFCHGEPFKSYALLAHGLDTCSRRRFTGKNALKQTFGCNWGSGQPCGASESDSLAQGSSLYGVAHVATSFLVDFSTCSCIALNLSVDSSIGLFLIRFNSWRSC